MRASLLAGSALVLPTLFFVAFLLALVPSVQAMSAEISYCKCICFGNSTVVPLYLPLDPKRPCTTCTKQFCLDQKLAICRDAALPDADMDTGTGKEGDVEARCFKRDSPRDRVIVTIFIFAVVGLLGTAFVRSKLERNGFDRRRFTEGSWWKDTLAKLVGRNTANGGQPSMDVRQGTYAPVSVGS